MLAIFYHNSSLLAIFATLKNHLVLILFAISCLDFAKILIYFLKEGYK